MTAKHKILTVLVVASFFILAELETQAQSQPEKVEVSDRVPMIRMNDFEAPGSALRSRIADKAKKYEFTIEDDRHIFSQDRFLEPGRQVQGLFEMKAGWRFKKFGIFAVARPGLMSFMRANVENACTVGATSTSSTACLNRSGIDAFAVDISAMLELYPSKRTVIRVNAGCRQYVAIQTFEGKGCTTFASIGIGFRW